jgi:hypothetical protein
MAATRLIALHINKGKTAAQCLADRTDYSQNEQKTDNGKYISAYACDPHTCDEEFLFSKRQYEHITGRHQAHDVIAYQIRQSFRPGEIAPEEANKIGYETAMRWTKGKHAFIVATHIDRAHIHNHIIYNSTSLDCTRKFKNFFLSGLAVARLSDLICLEHDLSIIDHKPNGEREKRTEYPHKPTHRDGICAAIDAAMQRKPKNFEELLQFLQEDGYECRRGKQPAVRGREQKRFIRFRSLGEGYSADELAAVIAGNAEHRSKFDGKNQSRLDSRQSHQNAKLSFLIDIQQKLREGKGKGYLNWAKTFNLKQRARAMLFMSEHKIESFGELVHRADESTAQTEALLESVKADEARLQEIAVLKTHLINYSKSREVYAKYKASGYSRAFYEEHRELLTLRRAARNAFDDYLQAHPKEKTLPRVKELSAEYAEVLTRKKKNYQTYRSMRKDNEEWQVAKSLVAAILQEELSHEEEQRRQQEQEKTH